MFNARVAVTCLLTTALLGATATAHAQGADRPAPSGAADRPWHLSRIAPDGLPADGGKDVDVYVVDSGIRATHSEFGGRIAPGYNTAPDKPENDSGDCAGHGTFVASLIAGKTYGVAKAATVHPVRVMDCNNAWKDDNQVVKGIDWVTAQVKQKLKEPGARTPIVNLSLESSGSDPAPVLDQALARLVDAGAIVVDIAGNFGRGDCLNSPKDPRAITAAATDRDDYRNYALNASSYGPCVTVFAPGAGITAASHEGDAKTIGPWSGTSFAAPLIVGALALGVQKHPRLTMAQAKQFITETAYPGALHEIGKGSPNLLLHIT
ncbi:S8 family peptidase [Kitasatospora sp. NPDC002227]|uniref:S8 family peptidase n=1 Tax=Kitasatospora sp. NPDC002227 TaxID=3154773 RepID=UPI0033205ABA